MSGPYEAWYTIRLGKYKVGSIYLTHDNEIGIFVAKKYHRIGIGKKALELLGLACPRSKYLANISPFNVDSQDFFTHLGFKLIQFTYAKEHK